MSVKVLISLPWVALIDLVGKGPSFRLLKCVKKWFMFIGMSSSVVCLAALILFQKFRGLLVFAASSLACNPAVALRFFLVWSEPCILSLPSRSYSVLWYSQGAFAHIWLNAKPLFSCVCILHRTKGFWQPLNLQENISPV